MDENPYLAAIRLLVLDTSVTDNVRTDWLTVIDNSARVVTQKPALRKFETARLLAVTLAALHETAVDRFGEGEHPFTLDPFPKYRRTKGAPSQVLPCEPGSERLWVGINDEMNSWEGAFYELAHEAIHLLSPVIPPLGANPTVATLDEGVAVHFAECMYDRYIRPYFAENPGTRPVGATYGINKQYSNAHAAASKLNDTALRNISDAFGGFPYALDSGRLHTLAAGAITDEEARILARPFDYLRLGSSPTAADWRLPVPDEPSERSAHVPDGNPELTPFPRSN